MTIQRESIEQYSADGLSGTMLAARIPGMTPAAISLLLVYLRKGGQKVA